MSMQPTRTSSAAGATAARPPAMPSDERIQRAPAAPTPARRSHSCRRPSAWNTDSVYIHPSAFVDRCCTIFDRPTAGVRVGARVVIGPNVYMYAGDRGIVIGDGALIGGGAIIMEDVTIGHDAVAGGAVVTRDVAPGHLVVGNDNDRGAIDRVSRGPQRTQALGDAASPYAQPQPQRQPELEPERERKEEKPDGETQIEGGETDEPAGDEKVDDTDSDGNVEEYLVDEVLDSRLSGEGEGALQYRGAPLKLREFHYWHPKKPGPPEDLDVWERAFEGDG
ncbi:hypothetical protein DL766_008213 [Monosporascus sp. MC13-8B]|uniref:Mannose-1-phosphate guanylyltransferase n=1 Tax=Monosporascus cannonballus TaxID=155416 RepID=A0ABY0H1E2_9PEZI|nr:hypothetical protein DL762_008216 [Monosporascus cannonballus]RYO81734.1 hypothetical protein DL763_008472 [Monosporascus cannonballus]RYP20354.1 hypothetical protein DL766_008213 [Monosporascus sp. MC13-8B]